MPARTDPRFLLQRTEEQQLEYEISVAQSVIAREQRDLEAIRARVAKRPRRKPTPKDTAELRDCRAEISLQEAHIRALEAALSRLRQQPAAAPGSDAPAQSRPPSAG